MNFVDMLLRNVRTATDLKSQNGYSESQKISETDGKDGRVWLVGTY